MKINFKRFFRDRWNWALVSFMVAVLLVGLKSAKNDPGHSTIVDTHPKDLFLHPVQPATAGSAITINGDPTRRASDSTSGVFANTGAAASAPGLSSDKSGKRLPAAVSTAATTTFRQTEATPGASTVTGAGSGTVPMDARQAPVPPGPRFQLPLAFQPVNPEALNPVIQSKLTQLQDEFTEAIGDTTDPADPTYQKRWISAQIQSDMQYRALFGQMAFQEMQIQRAQSASTQTQ